MKKDHCVACGSMDGIEHHHLVPRSSGGADDESNLITLCHSCHGKAHGFIRKDIKALTIDGLNRARDRGVRLGCPSPSNGGIAASGILRGQAQSFAESVRAHIDPIKDQPLRAIASHLTALGVSTRTGRRVWHPSQISNLLRVLYP